MYDFINTLSESKLVPSQRHYHNYTAAELADMAVLYLCALYILFNNPASENFARQYARRTMMYGKNFDHWQNGGTDLYAIIHGLVNQDVALDHPETSDKFRKTVPIGESVLIRWLSDMASNTIRTPQHRALFTRLDFNFKLANASIRAIRRLVMDWTDITPREHQLVMTRLLQLMRIRCPRSELLPELSKMARSYGLELHNVCNPETGDGCGDEGPVDRKYPTMLDKKSSFMATLAGAGLGLAASHLLHSKDKK